MTTTAPPPTPATATPPARRRTRRWLIAGGVLLALFAALVVATALLPESPERMPNSIANPRPNGTRALAQVLGRGGVEVTQETTLAGAVQRAEADTTLVVWLAQDLSPAAAAELSQVRADLVILLAGRYDVTNLEALTDQLVAADYWWSDGDDPPQANCYDPDALAAGTLTPSYAALYPLDDVVVRTCFDNGEDVALYADLWGAWHRVTVIAGETWLHNDTITRDGNAALALRVLGRHPRLTWYLPGSDAFASQQQASGELDLFTLLPPWSKAAFAVLLLAGAAAALWRGRRFGALVREPMPVEVPASEASSGLARLYRQAGARGHAAAGLRAATLHRVAGRLGLPPAATPELVRLRLGDATGCPPERINQLIYGPPPATDAALVDLASALTDLERKLTRE